MEANKVALSSKMFSSITKSSHSISDNPVSKGSLVAFGRVCNLLTSSGNLTL